MSSTREEVLTSTAGFSLYFASLKTIKMRIPKKGSILTWIRGKRKWLHPDDPPKEIRELDMFTYQLANCKCFIKLQGGWYKVTRDGKALFVARTLQDFALKEWLEIAQNDEFIANPK